MRALEFPSLPLMKTNDTGKEVTYSGPNKRPDKNTWSLWKKIITTIYC